MYLLKCIANVCLDAYNGFLIFQGSARFPKMAKVARVILGIPASSSASEDTFSDAGYLCNERKTGMLPTTVNATIVLRDYLKNLEVLERGSEPAAGSS